MHSKADQVLANAEHYEVLWRVGYEQEKERRERNNWPRNHEKKGCSDCGRGERVSGEEK